MFPWHDETHIRSLHVAQGASLGYPWCISEKLGAPDEDLRRRLVHAGQADWTGFLRLPDLVTGGDGVSQVSAGCVLCFMSVAWWFPSVTKVWLPLTATEVTALSSMVGVSHEKGSVL